MSNYFARQGAAHVNDLKRSFGALVGIAQGLLADQQLTDEEIYFLDKWLEQNSAIATTWPGDVVHNRIKQVLSDNIIEESEREHLVQTLQSLVGGSLDELSEDSHVTDMIFDDVEHLEFNGNKFCLTGQFIFASRDKCIAETEQRGGLISKGITKRLDYLVVGGMGSNEWKHGSFGTKIEKAMKYKRDGLPIYIVHEDIWANCL